MKKDLLIKKIASEFNVDEIMVSEYFDSIFGTLTAAFIKNKNVNISEFGKFKVKTKKDEEGEKKKTVLFSPVKKFADDVNYNFSELLPVQIRLMDSCTRTQGAGEDYDEELAEEILLIEFEEEYVFGEKAEVLIPEETKPEIHHEEPEKQKEDILIPETGAQEIPTLEAEKKKEDILIPEIPSKEVVSESIITEPPEEPVIKEKTEPEAECIKLDTERIRILEMLNSVKFPERIFVYIYEEIKPKKFSSAAQKIIADATIYIKDEKTEEEKIDDEIEMLKSLIAGEKEPEASRKEEIPEETVQEIFQEEKQDIFIEEGKETESGETLQEITQETEEEKKVEESPKSNLELEEELLKMLDERKKILEEISKLENSDLDDVVDISGPKAKGDGEKPTLYDENTLERPRQNIFTDEEGKVFEDLLNLVSGEKETTSESNEEKIIPETTETPEEEIISETNEAPKEEIIPENTEEPKEEIKEEELKEKKDFEEKTDEISSTSGSELNNLENLLGNLYEKQEDNIIPPGPKEVESHLNNREMKVFDKLLEDAVTPPAEESVPVSPETSAEQDNGLTSFSDLEKMFKSFKTEITDSVPIAELPSEKKSFEEKPLEEIPVKTETIKTYDDISNLIGPNGDKKEEKPAALPPEPPKKKMAPGIRLAFIFGIIIVIILFFVFFYEKFVYKPSEPPKQLPVTQPVDSTKTAGNDSVVYADTNKTKEQENSEIVFEKDDKVIKESPKGFFVEFGEYENQFVLAKEIKVLKDKGIAPGYEEIKSVGKTYYRIKLGPYKSLKEAKSILPKL